MESKKYKDKYGSKYKVVQSKLGKFRVCRQFVDESGSKWHSTYSYTTKWRTTFDEAQVDLDKIAKKEGFVKWNESEE